MERGCVSQKSEEERAGGPFQTCATPATSTQGKLPEQLRAQSCTEPPWQGLMFQVPLPSGRPPIHNPTNKKKERAPRLPLSGQGNVLQTLQMLYLAVLALSHITGLIQTDWIPQFEKFVNISQIWSLQDVMWV